MNLLQVRPWQYVRESTLALILLGAIFLSGCGYHLVGYGDDMGAIPADVRTVSLIVQGASDRQVGPMLKKGLSSSSYAWLAPEDVIDQRAHANLRVNISPVTFRPSSFDASGVATQYRMIFSGSVVLERQEGAVWQSGVIQRQGDVYVTGGPASIEAFRQELLEDLRQAWLQDLLGRLRSGF